MGKGFFAKIASLINGNMPDNEKEKLAESARNEVPAVEPIKDDIDNEIKEDAPIVEGTKIDEAFSEGEKDTEPVKNEPKVAVSKKEKGSQPIVTNGIDKRGVLLQKVVAILQQNYAGMNVSMNNKALVLCISDNLFYHSLLDNGFRNQLITTIFNQLNLAFGAVQITDEKLSNGTCVMTDCYLQVASLNAPQACKAIIHMVEGAGSLLEDKVVLDSASIAKLPGKRWNIGIGAHPTMTDGSHRINHIAIDDDSASANFVKNKFVSRAHAYITYSQQNGYMLHVEFGGTRAAGKRTHINRGGQVIELNNVLVPEVLQDGDYVVLSKHVHLLFKI
jgi:hypothetical protein